MQGKLENYSNQINLYDHFKTVTLKINDRVQQKTAIKYHDRSLSYKQLDELVDKISCQLFKRLKNKLHSAAEMTSVDDVKIIGVHLKPDENTIPILMSIHRLGCAYLPIDPLLLKHRIQHLLNDAKPICVVTNQESSSSLNEVLNERKSDIDLFDAKSFLDADDDDDDSIEKQNVEIEVHRHGDQIACVLYTSGSTGVPKGVCLPHSVIMNRLHWQWDVFPIENEADETVAFKTSLNFVDHIAEIFGFLLKGATVLVLDTASLANPNELINTIEANKITHFILVPSLLKNILNYLIHKQIAKKLDALKRFVCSGETLTKDLVELFFSANLKSTVLCNFYGSTEVMGDVTYIVLDSREIFNKTLAADKINVPLGKAISNSRIHLFDSNMNEIIEDNEPGEIYVSGLCLAQGYLDKNRSLNEKDKNRFMTINDRKHFKTGDFGFYANGLLYFSGRQDTQIKIRGKRVDLNELEYNALKISGIAQFIPLIYDPSEFNKELSITSSSNKLIIAFYRVTDALAINKTENEINEMILNGLKQFVFDYMIPAFLIRLDEIPYLINGKIDKIALKSKFSERFNGNMQPASGLSSTLDLTMEDLIFNLIKLSTGYSSFTDTTNRDALLDLTLSQLGINSLNAIDIYLNIEKSVVVKAHQFTFEDFLSCISLRDLIDKLNCSSKATAVTSSGSTENRYKSVSLSKSKEYAKICMKFVSETYPYKSELDMPYADEQGFHEFYAPIADCLEDSEESFLVYDTFASEYVGGAFVADVSKEIKLFKEKNESLYFILEMLDQIEEKAIKANHLADARVLSCKLVGVKKTLGFQEIMLVLDFIEDEIIRRAIYHGYDAITTVNTNKATQDVCSIAKGYVIVDTIYPCNYEIDNRRLLSDLSSSYKIEMCIKYLPKSESENNQPIKPNI